MSSWWHFCQNVRVFFLLSNFKLKCTNVNFRATWQQSAKRECKRVLMERIKKTDIFAVFHSISEKTWIVKIMLLSKETFKEPFRFPFPVTGVPSLHIVLFRSYFSWRARFCHHSVKELQSLDVGEAILVISCRAWGWCRRELCSNCLRKHSCWNREVNLNRVHCKIAWS